jgi:hypothetical protein
MSTPQPNAPPELRVCPRCGRSYAADVRFCVPCSINLETGTEVTTTAEGVPDDDRQDAEAESSPLRLMLSMPSLVFPGLFNPVLLALIVLAEALSLYLLFRLPYPSVYAMSHRREAGLILIALVLHGQALCWLLTGRGWFLKRALPELDSLRQVLFTILFIPMFILAGWLFLQSLP